MANFNTHVSAAFLGAGGAALLAINTQLINWLEAPWLVFLGTIGGLLPDIDSDNSKQVKTVFFSTGHDECPHFINRRFNFTRHP